MGFIKENDKMNYCYEAGISGIYDFCIKFISEGRDVFSLDQVTEMESFILPPHGFGDSKYRDLGSYNRLMDLFSEIKNTKKMELENSRTK